MKAVVELIGEHTATGVSSKQSRLGASGKPGGWCIRLTGLQVTFLFGIKNEDLKG